MDKIELNEADSKEFLRVKNSNPEFADIYYGRLITLRWRVQSTFTMNSDLPFAGMLRGGKKPIAAAIAPAGMPVGTAKALLASLSKDARLIASDLADFFPAERHYYWEKIFVSIALGGSGNVRQLQNGGPPGLSDEEKLYRKEKMLEVDKIKARDPGATWREIAKDIKWRHGYSKAGSEKLRKLYQKHKKQH